jgi:hypothetical protein
MQTKIQAANQMVRRVLTMVFLAPAALAAADLPKLGELVDRPAERSLVVALNTGDSLSGLPVGQFGERSVVVRVPRTVVLHRFRVELLDAAGTPIASPASWGLSLFSVTSGEFEPVARLTTSNADVRLPRPYGVRITSNDSLMVVASLAGADAPEGSYLQLTLEYEATETAISRLAVTSQSTTEAPDASSAWTWVPAEKGRLVAISGRALACADELVLEDATTGAVLWRTRTASPVPSIVSTQQSEVIRPGVVLEAGRVYRLRAAYADAAAACGSGTPVAITFPGAHAGR